MSPKAMAILAKDHPKYHAKEIKAYEYGTCFEEVKSFDLVYHCAVMCQVKQLHKLMTSFMNARLAGSSILS